MSLKDLLVKGFKWLKGTSDIAEPLLQWADLLQIKKLRDAFGEFAANATKATFGKGATKREFGQSFVKLTLRQQDAIREIMDELRKKDTEANRIAPGASHQLENFVINASLYGDSVDDTTELLRILASYTPAEACEMIDYLDLEKDPVHHVRNAGKKSAEVAGEVAKWLNGPVADSLKKDNERLERELLALQIRNRLAR